MAILQLEEYFSEELSEEEPSEIDVDEYVYRSIRKRTSIIPDADKRDMFTVNSKILPVLADTFEPIITAEIELPDFTSMKPFDAIETMGELVGIKDHDVNLISFWVLDTIAGCLQVVQKKNMSMSNQKVLIAWYGVTLKLLAGKKLNDTIS